MIDLRKTLVVGVAAATLATGFAASSTPAAAWGYHPFGWGAAAAAATGLAVAGAAAAASTPYYYTGACYISRQPVTDVYGNVVGFQRVRVCQ